MHNSTIAFIGGGNMGRSLVGGLIAGGFSAARIRVSDPDPERLDPFTAQGVTGTTSNVEAADGADAIVFAVKPQVLREVAGSLAPELEKGRPLAISIAAGIRSDTLQRWLGGNIPVVRAMPNTPALVQSGATALFAGAGVSTEQHELAESILRSVGLALWVEDEALMDTVTALSGSGPAYFFLVMEALEAAAQTLGLDEKSARLLTIETALGAARMALESPEPPAVLRQRVTSPGGTTERALAVMENRDIRGLLAEALTAARDRSMQLSEQLGSE